MDIKGIISELSSEREQVEQEISILERSDAGTETGQVRESDNAQVD
jgi:hypothetical protein